ncbi:MAG: trypsin-like peptidase domain-containing protein [Gaiellales bacterium]
MSDPAPQQPPITPPDPEHWSRRRSRISALAALVAASALGGGAALGAAAAVGALGGTTTTTVVEAEPAGTAATAAKDSLSVGEIYRRAGAGVVQITTTSGSGGGLGSGFVIDNEGHIVTNYHVVDQADTIRVAFGDGETVDATLVGTDPSSDLALLDVDVPAATLHPLRLADSDRVRVGDPVVAIGNPFGLERTVTAGIVSALQRAVRAPNGFAIDRVIQTDAPINQGNSGGPLIDAHGRVIGVNSQIETGGSGATGNVGIGFAVPANTVERVVSTLLEDGKVEHAYLGVTLQPLDASIAKALGLEVNKGLLVQDVHSGTPAASAGLHGGRDSVVVDGQPVTKGGDVIVFLDGQELESVTDLRDRLDRHAPGDKVTLTVLRDGKELKIPVVLGKQPPTAS